MIRYLCCMGAFLVPFCMIIAVDAAFIKQVGEVRKGKDTRTNNKSPSQNSFTLNEKDKVQDLEGHLILNEEMPPEPKLVLKREAKRPKNKKRRLKFSKKKMQHMMHASDESKLGSKTYEIKNGESAEAAEFSELYMPWKLPPRPTRSRHPKKSEAKSHPSEISTCEDPTEEMYDPPRRYEKEVFFDD